MAKIAAELRKALKAREASGSPGRAAARLLAEGDGWTVEDVVCTSGPDDRVFAEQHGRVSIAIVIAGSFQYGAASAHACRELMTPGSLLLGSLHQTFACGHEHASGDRCLSFKYDPAFFEQLMADTGVEARRDGPGFPALRVPPLRTLAPLVARGCAGLTGELDVAWDELGLELATATLRLLSERDTVTMMVPPAAQARVTSVVRRIDDAPDAALDLAILANEAGLSPFHFLRTFERVTGVTPHQYVLRTRLRRAALRLVSDQDRVVDIAFDSGFGDVSNFNRAFRTEFGVSPRAYRAARTT